MGAGYLFLFFIPSGHVLWPVLGQAFGSIGLVLAHIWEDVGSIAQMEAEGLLGSTAGAQHG